MNLLHATLAGSLVVGATVLVEVQSTRTVADLTVPANQLPTGCGLKPLDPKPVMPPGGGVVTMPSYDPLAAPTNPWAGSDRRMAAGIRKRIDGEPQMTDAPFDRRAAAAYELMWAEDVVEAYRATYRAADESIVDVFAVRFNDPALAKPMPTPGVKNPPRGLRLVVGPMVVLLDGRDSACFQAVSKHLQSLR